MIPKREALRAAYDAVIKEIDSARGSQQLTNAFYAKVGNAVFDACYRAVEHSAQGVVTLPPRLHVVSAPMGTGKTSFTLAFITALVRLGESDAQAPHSCAFLVEQMAKAEEMYRELSALLPGKVAVWTTDHDISCTKPTKVLNPAKRFRVDELENHAVAIVTHAFYKGPRGNKARSVLHNGVSTPRTLTIIDEQSDDVEIFDVTLAGVAAVLEAVKQDEQKGDVLAPYLEMLFKFMADKELAGGGSLEKPSDDPTGWDSVAPILAWFTTSAASDYVRDRQNSIRGLEAVFGFAKSMATGYAFIVRQGGDAAHFVGYQNNLPSVPGMVLLDATADIDGVTQLCPWRSHSDVPTASYANLSIVHVKSCTTQRLYKFLKFAKNRHAYVDWMKQTILAYTEPGQQALVVCNKTLFDNRNVPDWPERDERFDKPDLYVREYGWELEGRKLCGTHWGGFGIGANTWKDADVVFLFDEFHVPRRVTIARAQGLASAKATEGPLGTMDALKSKSPLVDGLHEGHLLRWTKQMALRGKGRHFDEHGVCGHQKLVCSGDYERLIANAEKLFPGASITKVGDTANTYAEKFLAVLSRPGLPDSITTKWISEQINVPWRRWGPNVLKRPETQASMKSLGWRYDPGRGRAGGKFVQDTEAALMVDREFPVQHRDVDESILDSLRFLKGSVNTSQVHLP
jgi:hypothetical protein